jgi:hypothetical protein
MGTRPTEVWVYTVGGRNVLRSWFNYRKAVPGGKKTSPLDCVHVDAWPREWTIELIDLLTVLTRLVELEVDQAKLLDDILAGHVFTSDAVAEQGIRWPTGPSDRKPRTGYREASTLWTSESSLRRGPASPTRMSAPHGAVGFLPVPDDGKRGRARRLASPAGSVLALPGPVRLTACLSPSMCSRSVASGPQRQAPGVKPSAPGHGVRSRSSRCPRVPGVVEERGRPRFRGRARFRGVRGR